MEDDRTFELGLVMAGAISAGAYTAGVLDFLLQALSQWQKAKNRGMDCPQHRVKIKAIAGASAGGISAALLATLLNEDVEPITSMPGRLPAPEAAAQNRLYDVWVRQISIERLLETRDLHEDAPHLRSLLDSTVLDEIAEDALQFSPEGRQRPAFADKTHLFLTLTNLRGVPYAIDMRGDGASHALSMHADYMHFALSRTQPTAKEMDDALWLDLQNPEHENWQVLRRTALATGAFPGALLPRMLQRSSQDYVQRTWPIPQASGDEGTERQIPPAWPDELTDGSSEEAGFDYRSLYVDGGIMDNEPLELVRRQLAGPGATIARHSHRVTRSVLMVDPFPGSPPMSQAEAEKLDTYGVLKTLRRLATSLRMQARFKMDELVLAQTSSVYSRFMIAPVRYATRDGQEVKASHPVASGVLGGFGGFLSKRFRQHDFQLGRRNCQQFLRKHFTLPLEKAKRNPIFAGDDPEALDHHVVREDGEPITVDGDKLYPIIPLVGTAQEEAFPLRWNTIQMNSNDLEPLREQVAHRTQAVSRRLIENQLGSFFNRTLAKLVLRFKRDAIVDRIMDTIRSDLERYDLLH